MATSHNITTTYSGQASSPYLSAALLTGKSLASGAIDIKDNIKYKEVLQVISSDANLIKPGTCDFSATGELTTTEVVIEPKEIQVNLTLCAKNYRSGWESLQMQGIKSGIPKTLGDFILDHVVKKTAASIETAIWSNTTSSADIPFDGFETLAAANGDVVDVAAVAGGITASNVTTELLRVFSAMPNTIKGAENAYIYASTDIFFKYVTALGGFGADGSSATTRGLDGKYATWYGGQQELNFNGVKVLHCPGMTATKMIGSTSNNMIFGSSLYSELNQASVLDMSSIDGSQNARVILRGSAAVAIGIGSELVLYA
jgi:hypothetical protein